MTLPLRFDHCGVYAHVDRNHLSTIAIEAWCAAANEYIREDVWPAWERVLRRPPPNFFYYGRGMTLPIQLPDNPAGILLVKEQSPDPNTGGFHFFLGKMPAGRVYLSGGSSGMVFGHETAEMAVNPLLSLWYPGPKGYDYSGEVCDPVQTQSYEREVRGLGRRVTVTLPNFVYPAYFGLKTGDSQIDSRLDHLGRLSRPFEIARGGYQIIRLANGDTGFIGPDHEPLMLSTPKFESLARTRQIVEGRTVPEDWAANYDQTLLSARRV